MAGTDPYQVLGVAREADEKALRAAYRALAKKFHPDLNPGKPEAAERFKQINAAYDLLSDKDKRARFDRGEIDPEGNETRPAGPTWRDFAEAAGRQKYRTAGSSEGFEAEDLEDILGGAFGFGTGGRAGGAGGGTRARMRMRGADAHYTLAVSFLDAARGATRRITLPDARTLDVRIPAGVRDGHVLRLRGQGSPGFGEGAPAGDALVEIAVASHPHFRREGDDILIDLPVTLREAVLGAAIEVPTVRGKVRLNIPPGSGTGTRLRLRGRGIGAGHQYVILQVVVPQGEEPELSDFLRQWTPRHDADPRTGMEEEA